MTTTGATPRDATRRTTASDVVAVARRLAHSMVPRWRVWLLSAGMLVGAAVIYGVVLRDAPGVFTPIKITWPVMALLFVVTETWRVYLHFRRNAQSFALSEIPMVI